MTVFGGRGRRSEHIMIVAGPGVFRRILVAALVLGVWVSAASSVSSAGARVAASTHRPTALRTFSFVSVVHDTAAGVAVLNVYLPRAGKLVVSGAGVRTVKLTVARAGLYPVALEPMGNLKRKLSRGGSANVTAHASYTPRGRGALAARKTVKLTKTLGQQFAKAVQITISNGSGATLTINLGYLTGGIWDNPPVSGSTILSGDERTFTNGASDNFTSLGGEILLTPATGGSVTVSWTWPFGTVVSGFCKANNGPQCASTFAGTQTNFPLLTVDVSSS